MVFGCKSKPTSFDATMYEEVEEGLLCPGCNERGHSFIECPYRSDDALEGEDEEEDDDDEF